MKLVKYEAAKAAVAECKAVDEVKDWADRAAAMQAYARMAKDKAMEIDAAEIRIRAERRLGELIAAQKAGPGLHKGGRPPKDAEKTCSFEEQVKTRSSKEQVSLEQVGIDRKLSSRAQKLAAVPADEFEAEIGDWRERVSRENARVTARLERAGERAASRDAAEDAEQAKKDALDEALAQVERLTEQVKALSASDVAAELKRQIEIRQGIEQRLSDQMEKCRMLQRELDGYGRWYAELRKITGLQTRSEITEAIRQAIGRSVA